MNGVEGAPFYGLSEVSMKNMLRSYGLAGVERDREIWLRYAVKYFGHDRRESEDIFQDCMLHCWLMYDFLTYQEWRFEFRKRLAQRWEDKRWKVDREALRLDDFLRDDDKEAGKELYEIVRDSCMGVELQVIVRQAGGEALQVEWDRYEELNKPHKKEQAAIRRGFDLSLYRREKVVSLGS